MSKMEKQIEAGDGQEDVVGDITHDAPSKPQKKFKITIEPYMFIALFGLIMTYMTMQNLLLDKACRVDLELDDDICDALASRNVSAINETLYEEKEKEVHSVLSEVNTWKFFVDHTIPILFCLVMGAWSDKHGRKPLFISAQLGYFAGALSLIWSVYRTDFGVSITVVLYGVFHGLGGASVALNLAMMAYMGDVSSEETKTQRLGIVMLFFLSATPIANAAAGPLFDSLGYYWTFGIGAACSFTALLYAIFIVEETVDTRPHRATIFIDLFDASQAIASMRSLFRKRKGWLRAKIIALCSLVFFTTFYFGEMSFLYLFVTKEFRWTYTDYGIYNTYRFLVNIVGMIFTLGVVSFYFGVSDPAVGIMGCTSQVGCSIAMAISVYYGEILLYIAPVIDLLNGAVIIVNKSLLTKTVPHEELGQLSAVLCTVEAIVPTVSNPIYNIVYKATLDTDIQGAPFLVTAATMVICIIVFLFLYFDHQASERKSQKVVMIEMRPTKSETF